MSSDIESVTVIETGVPFDHLYQFSEREFQKLGEIGVPKDPGSWELCCGLIVRKRSPVSAADLAAAKTALEKLAQQGGPAWERIRAELGLG